MVGPIEGVERTHERPGGETEKPADIVDLGRLLFERNRNENLVLSLVASTILGGMGATMLADRTTRWEAVGPLVVAVGVLILGLVFGRDRFRCYERGLSRRTAGEFQLLYDEISEITYSAIRIFVNGHYSGTKMKMTVRAPRGEIFCAAKVQITDDRMVELRDRVAEKIADRMLLELQAGKPVPWMSGIVLLPEGLQFRRGSMPASSTEVLRYSEIGDTRVNQGTFYLFSKMEPRAVISRPVSSTNFFPGYRAMAAMQRKDRSE